MKQYDAIIIGFGKGGKLLAAELAERNWKVAIVERSPQMYGGTCVNVGCIPTKALIHESEYAEKRYYDDYKNQSKLYALAVARKDKLVSFLREKNYENVKNKPNITLYDGTASFLSENTIRIVSGKDETILEGKEIFINTGSTPILPAIDGLKESKYVYTSETIPVRPCCNRTNCPHTCSSSAAVLSDWSLPLCMQALEAMSHCWKRETAFCLKWTATLPPPCWKH